MSADFIDMYQPHSMEPMRPNMVVSGYRTLRLRNRSFPSRLDGDFEEKALKIVDELVQDEELLNEGPISEQLRREAVKELPYTLTMKRRIKEHLTRSMARQKDGHSRPLGFWTALKYKIKHSWNQFKEKLFSLNYLHLWHGSLKEIEGRFGSSYASYFRFVRWMFVTNVCLSILPLLVLVLPQIFYDAAKNVENPAGFKVEDIFVGDGYFKNTVLFYGHYRNQTFDLIPGVYFDMPAAYFSIFAVLYVVSFVVLSISVATSYNKSYIATEGGLKNAYANKIFCGWDHAIATKEAANLKSLAIFNELKELLSVSLKDEDEKSFCRTFGMFLYHSLVNVLVLGFLGLLGWSLWLLLDSHLEGQHQGGVVVTAVTANVMMTVVPTVLSVVTRLEKYKNPKTALNVNLARTFLLGFVVVGVILGFWLTDHSKNCWETQLGQEIYRLVLFDFIISIVFMTLIEFAVYYAKRLFCKNSGKSEFNVARHTLQIIYNQTLFWIGLFYSPILPLIVALKMFLMWYIHKMALNYLCVPPTKLWRDAQTQTWFKVLTFISILFVIMVQGYTLKNVETSKTCGPFSSYNYTYEIILTAVADIEDTSVFWKILSYLVKPGVVTFIMIGLSVLVYYFKEQSLAQKERVGTLRLLLQWTAKDKEYLNNYYNELMKNMNKNHYENIQVTSKYKSPNNVLDNREEGRTSFIGSVPRTSEDFRRTSNQNRRRGDHVEEVEMRFKKYF